MKPNPPGVAAATRCSSVNWFSAIFVAPFLTIISASAAVPQAGAAGMNPAEKWVVAQIRAGEIADLSRQFPDEEKEKRKLRAHFLEELLTGALPGFKPHRNGVRIIGAIIDEAIDLTNAQIPCELWLSNCQLLNSVSFLYASVVGGVSFEDSVFKADANFARIKVVGDAFFNGTVFEGPVNFGGANIAGEFRAVETQFKDKENGADFVGMKVGGGAFFEKAVFDGPVNFSYADFGLLALSSPSSPKVAPKFDLQGMSYKYIRVVEKKNHSESHRALLKLADQSAYTADVYSNLEEFLNARAIAPTLIGPS